MRRIALVVSALVILVSACQAASEQLTEQIIEQQVGVNDVDIDQNSGQVSVETDEGSIVIGGGEIPDGFPIPAPDGYEVRAAFTSDSEGSVALAYPADRFDELVSFYEGWTSSHGSDWNSSTQTYDLADGTTIRNLNWNNDEMNIGVVDCTSIEGDGLEVCVNLLQFG